MAMHELRYSCLYIVSMNPHFELLLLLLEYDASILRQPLRLCKECVLNVLSYGFQLRLSFDMCCRDNVHARGDIVKIWLYLINDARQRNYVIKCP